MTTQPPKPTPVYVGHHHADTSRTGTRRKRGLPSSSGKPFVPSRPFFPAVVIAGKVKAPLGYAFNGRGDLIRTQPKIAALRSAARKARTLTLSEN